MKVNKKLNITAFLLVLTVISLLSPCVTVKAGGINGNESEIIGVISGTFEIDGKTYRFKSSYISEAKAYLSSDDIDLTSEQSGQAVSEIYNNLETALSSGYMELVETNNEETSTTETTADPSDNNQVESTEDSTGSSDNNQIESTGNSNNISNNNNTETTKPDATTSVSTNQEPTKSQNVANVSNEIDNAIITVKDTNNQTILQLSSVIKNTGFSIQRTIITGSILSFIFIVVFAFTLKNYLFTHKDEIRDEKETL